MALQFDGMGLSVVALYCLLGVLYLSTGSAYLAFKSGAPLRPVLWLLIYVDVIVLSMVVHYSGGSSSYFTILFVLPILVGGIYFEIAGGLITALLAISAYIIYSMLELGGYVQLPSSALSVQGIYHPLLRGYLYMAVFIFTGLLSGYISRHIRHRGEELADREMEIRHIQLSTDNIIKNMSSGLVVTNMVGEILSVNPAAVSILGLQGCEDLEGKFLDDAAGYLKPLIGELSSALDTGEQRRRHELVVRRGDGTALPLGVSISILRGDEGEKRGVIALFQDLTEVRKMIEMVRQSDKMAAVGELSAAIAHEIRAPLASICGSIEMLTGELELSGENKTLMDLIIRESDRLDRIITDFLDFARLRKPSLMPVDVEQCLKEVLLLLQHSPILNSKISMEIVNEIRGTKIYADCEQIRQVFLNLGLNACEAIDKGGKFTVTIGKIDTQLSENGKSEECLRIDFENDGPPIPQDVQERVFEPFYTTKNGGTGLGLAMAARIVRSHNGLIRVERSDSVKTVFSVILPVFAQVADEEELIQEELICI